MNLRNSLAQKEDSEDGELNPSYKRNPIPSYKRNLGSDVVSFCYVLKTTKNPGNKVSRKTELVSIRVNVTLD
jgi:hypothetical protein